MMIVEICLAFTEMNLKDPGYQVTESIAWVMGRFVRVFVDYLNTYELLMKKQNFFWILFALFKERGKGSL